MAYSRAVVFVVVAGMMAAMLAGCGGSKVSKSNYDKISNDMTLAEVEKILGKGKQQTGGGIGPLSAKVVQWADGDKTITVTFMNDKVTMKTQTGL